MVSKIMLQVDFGMFRQRNLDKPILRLVSKSLQSMVSKIMSQCMEWIVQQDMVGKIMHQR